MAADPKLLDLQALDLRHDRLVRRRGELPEAGALAESTTALAETEVRIAGLAAEHAEVDRNRSRLDGEIDLHARKAKSVQDKLFSGTVASPRELSALQADAAQLERQQGELEEQLLEVLMQLDELTPQLDGARADAALLRERIGTLEIELGAATAEIDAELAEIAQSRSGTAGEIDPALVARYESIRASNRGTGAARLAGSTCEACHLGLSNADIVEIRDAEVGTCPNCGALVVLDA